MDIKFRYARNSLGSLQNFGCSNLLGLSTKICICRVQRIAASVWNSTMIGITEDVLNSFKSFFKKLQNNDFMKDDMNYESNRPLEA